MSLPHFDDIVVEIGEILDEEVFAPSGCYTKYCIAALGSMEVGQWIEDTLKAQLNMMVNGMMKIGIGEGSDDLSLGVPWSVCVVPCHRGAEEHDGFGLVVVVTLASAIVRPLGKVVPALDAFINARKRLAFEIEREMLLSLNSDEDGRDPDKKICTSKFNTDECWLCLEPFVPDEVNLIWNADFFCCGHLVCPECTPAASGLRLCGVCRAPPPPKHGLEDMAISRVKRT